jgi:selenocysteine-specific elongation factor
MAFVSERGIAGLPATAIVSRAGLPPARAKRITRALAEAKRLVEVGELLVASPIMTERAEALRAAVEQYHASQPLSPGLPREEARERLFGSASGEVFDAVLSTLAAAGQIVARDTLALAGHQLSLSPEEARARDVLTVTYREAGFAPPDPRAAGEAAGVNPAVGDRMVKLLIREKSLVRLGDVLFHADTLARLKSDLREMKARGTTTLDVAFFKERYGVSRKFAIPLLEYLDRERVTRRAGEARVIL